LRDWSASTLGPTEAVKSEPKPTQWSQLVATSMRSDFGRGRPSLGREVRTDRKNGLVGPVDVDRALRAT
jgi:hypothetical protein